MDQKSERELFKTLGRIETKIESLCLQDHEQKKNLHNLEEDIKTKVNWKLLIPILGALFVLIMGAYAYTFDSSKCINDRVNIISNIGEVK